VSRVETEVTETSTSFPTAREDLETRHHGLAVLVG
jgi:hypothetical protein